MTFIRQSVPSLRHAVKQRLRQWAKTALTVYGRTIVGDNVNRCWNALGSMGIERCFRFVTAGCGMGGVSGQDRDSSERNIGENIR